MDNSQLMDINRMYGGPRSHVYDGVVFNCSLIQGFVSHAARASSLSLPTTYSLLPHNV